MVLCKSHILFPCYGFYLSEHFFSKNFFLKWIFTDPCVVSEPCFPHRNSASLCYIWKVTMTFHFCARDSFCELDDFVKHGVLLRTGAGVNFIFGFCSATDVTNIDRVLINPSRRSRLYFHQEWKPLRHRFYDVVITRSIPSSFFFPVFLNRTYFALERYLCSGWRCIYCSHSNLSC